MPIVNHYAPSKYFVLASLLSYCFVTHYNAPRYYKEIKAKDQNPSSFPIFATISYLVSALIYIATMVCGVTLFGSRSQSFALNSFSVADPLANIARIAFGSSVLASFPLIFLSVRTWCLELLRTWQPKLFEGRDEGAGIRPASLLLISGLAVLASKLTDIGVVGSLSGGLLGSSMMFVFPPIMYSGALMKAAKKKGSSVSLHQLYFNAILTVMGASLGFFGTGLTIASLLKK